MFNHKLKKEPTAYFSTSGFVNTKTNNENQKAKSSQPSLLYSKINYLHLTYLSQVNYTKMTIGQKIRELREKSGMLQRELAYELKVGDTYLSKIERNQKMLKKEHLFTISKVFNFPYSDLETLWLANKVYDIVKDEKKAIEILKAAEQEIKYRKTT